MKDLAGCDIPVLRVERGKSSARVRMYVGMGADPSRQLVAQTYHVHNMTPSVTSRPKDEEANRHRGSGWTVISAGKVAQRAQAKLYAAQVL